MVKDLVRDAAALTGTGGIFAGLWMMYPPVALVIVGGLVLAAAIRGRVNDSEHADGETEGATLGAEEGIRPAR
jgi:hypothetical protein